MGTLLQNFQKHFADVKGADVGLPSIMPLVNVAKGAHLPRVEEVVCFLEVLA